MANLRMIRNWTWALVSAVLLLVVVAHALVPVEHGRGRGSAFSASTEEVSLKSGARALVAKEIVHLDPLGPLAATPLAIMASIFAPVGPEIPFGEVAPVAASPALGPISPRAPPFA